VPLQRLEHELDDGRFLLPADAAVEGRHPILAEPDLGVDLGACELLALVKVGPDSPMGVDGGDRVTAATAGAYKYGTSLAEEVAVVRFGTAAARKSHDPSERKRARRARRHW
jgi:hypothetical protein